MADRLELEARFNDHASAGVKRLGKTLESVRPSNGMQAASKWMGEFRGAAEKANVAVRPMTTTLTALGVGGLAASMSLGEIVKQMRDLGDSTLTMKELGRQSGMTMDQIRRLNYAAGKLHVDPSAVTSAIKSWSNQMLDFRTTRSEFYRQLMHNNNADVAKKIAADSPEQGFKDTLDYLSRIPAAAMKAGKSQADAMQIQRRMADMAGVGDMVPALAEGPEGIRDAMAEAAQNVKPMTAEMVAAAERMNSSTNRMNTSWDNLKNDIGPSVLGPMSTMIDKLDETLKLAAASPGDAVAGAAVIAGSFAAFWARARIMRGSALAGGGGAMGRAAGEMVGAASQQKLATTTFAEAVAEFRLGVREMAARGGGVPPSGPLEPGKSGVPEVVKDAPKGFFGKGGFKGLAGGVAEGLLSGFIYDMGEKAENWLLGWTPKNQATLDHASSLSTVVKDIKDQWFGGGTPSASDKWKAPPTSTLSPEDYWKKKNAYLQRDMHPDDDRLSRARPGDLKADVQEGSKAGIIAGLRELAQQQELGGAGGDGGPGGTLGAAARVLGKAGIATGARPRAGGGFTPATGGGTTRTKGALAANQKEAYAAALGEGLSPTAARALVANMSGESLANAKDYHQDGPHMASGIVQWDPTRSAAIKAKFGAMPHQMSVADQTRAAIWEMKTRPEYAATWKALHGDNGADMIGALVDNYENPKYHAPAKAARMGYYRGFNPDAQPAPGAGTPPPAAAAVTDAEVFAARQRLIAGGHDPKDIALRDRYLKEQNTPKAHATGGAIRGRGTGTSDSIPAWLSNGEFVVNARASGQWLPFLHAINAGHTYADGGQVDAGLARRRSWLNFFQRPRGDGGMGAPRNVALGATAMMQGESGRGLNPSLYGWDVNGPSGGTAQWHDVTTGKYAGKLHRLSDLMRMAMLQHEDWHSVPLQQANWKREATGSLAGAWTAMRRAGSAAETLRRGINLFENPADHLGELRRRLPNIVRLARETSGGGETRVAHEIDPVQVDIRHHPHTGQPIVQARAGKGVKLGIRTAPMMRPT